MRLRAWLLWRTPVMRGRFVEDNRSLFEEIELTLAREFPR